MENNSPWSAQFEGAIAPIVLRRLSYTVQMLHVVRGTVPVTGQNRQLTGDQQAFVQ